MKKPSRMIGLLGLAGLAGCGARAAGGQGIGTGAPAQGVAPAPASAPMVRVESHPEERRVDVLVDGAPFTSYIWPASLKKPVLFPLRDARGTVVTRGYPLEPRPGERVDHPHHAGLWFNYGNVNGLDFWNNSTAIRESDAHKMGTILHRSVDGTTSGAGEGTLDVTTEWVTPAGTPILRERTHFIFRAAADLRSIDRITSLTALSEPVTFQDDKEGLIGMRVARALEHPSLAPEKFTDASGRVTTVAAVDTAGVTGMYRSSEGRTGDAVWGTRGRWATLSGVVQGDTVRIAMFDHPSNPGYPTYWHARGYGLFAANPLGQKVFSQGKETLGFRIDAGQTTTFRHQVLIMSGARAHQDIEPYWAGFVR